MMTKRAHLLVLAAIACLPLACKDGGCGGGGNGGAPSASATAALSAAGSTQASSNPRVQNKALMVRAGGPVGALFRAASQLELKDEQRTKIEKIAADLREADKAVEGDGGRHDTKAIQDEIIAGVKAGKIDLAKITPHLASLEKDAKERQTRDLDALGKLHDALEPAQRTKIAQGVKKTDDERAARMKTMETAQAAHGADGGKPSMIRRRYERYGRDLALDADQKAKLDAMIPVEDPKAAAETREEMKKRSDATLAEFEKETFDAKSLAPPDAKRLRQPIEEQVKFYNSLLPILKPEQKEKLAARVEKQGGGPMRKHGAGAGGGEGDHDHDNDDREDRDPH